LWWFRLCAVVLVPVLLLSGLELTLRLFDYGYPTSFFLRTQIDGRGYFVTNDKFGYRFFPPVLARTPSPMRMTESKSTNSYRIFLFGESAAQGDPDPTFGAGRYLEALLRERYPETDFEVVCVAMTAINSHAILPIARECARHEGDLWIVYMGNNEMVGPFGAATVFGPAAPKLSAVRASLAIKATKIGQLMEALVSRFRGNSSAPKSWGGMRMFKEHQLQFDDPGRLRAYENFRGNLRDILRAGQKAGVPIILSTVASNLKDCAPFASAHGVVFDENQKFAWDKNYGEGAALETTGFHREALGFYAKAAEIDSRFAELYFRSGRCHVALTNLDQARRDFELARDYDTLAFRADTRVNAITKEAAATAGKGVYLVDAAEVLAQDSRDGIPGSELFYEHVHLNFDGNYLLARAFADQVAKLLPSSITARSKGNWATAEFCDNRLAVSPWDRYRVWQANFSRVSEPPFTEQLNDVPRAQMYMAKLKELNSEMTPDASAKARAMYQEALALAPLDTSLHGNYAQFLDGIGDLPQAVQEQQRVCELLPLFPAPFHRLGQLLVRQGKTTEAAKCFSRALALRDDYVPALNELGLILANQQKTAEAAMCFTNALRMNPGYVEAHLNLGFLEQSEGRLQQAMTCYRNAADLQPNGPAEHFNHGVIFAVEHKRSDAINFFQAAVWMNPAFWQARYLLGVELAAEEKVEDARAQFLEVVRLRPDFAKAHMNLGVALAKQGKLDDALKEFQATLQLNPTNKSAQQNMDTIQAVKNRKK
jgi:tetratricopeptide (TPR) repeat protein